MLIEVLYIPGCCNHHPAVDRVRRLLVAENLEWPIIEVQVSDETVARSLQFPGSPTVRINSVDVEPIRHAQAAFACRLYSGGSGLPSEAALRHAISAANIRNKNMTATAPTDNKPHSRRTILASVGALGTAILASS